MIRLTGQQRLAKRLGEPATGMCWCTGYNRAPHQVDADSIRPGTCKCRDCITGYNRDYQRGHPRPDQRSRDRPTLESYARPVPPIKRPPGNDGVLQFPAAPTWGYACQYSENQI